MHLEFWVGDLGGPVMNLILSESQYSWNTYQNGKGSLQDLSIVALQSGRETRLTSDYSKDK